LRETFDRVTEYYQTIFDLSKDEYDKPSASRISNDLQSVRDKIKEIERLVKMKLRNLAFLVLLIFKKISLSKYGLNSAKSFLFP
jgi:hypothetical protein